ncbi:hypothetical protein QBC39DRAFT_337517 [Podospora conica]|nr:hypothetical protein QBC39DRAFT_337517 [Schizothecium conicum]
MATVVEKTASGTIYRSSQTRQLPQLDLLTVLFESKHCAAEEDTVLHIDAADPTKAITKAELRPLVKRLASTFRNDYGIGKDGPNNDAILLIATGHWHLPTIFFAAIAAGGVFSSSNPGSTPKELAGQVLQVDAKIIVCTEDTKATALAAANLTDLPPSRVLVIGNGASFSLSHASTGKPIPLSPNLLDWARITDPTALENSIVCVLFSSGTTGKPKACLLSHTNLVSSASLVLDASRETDPLHLSSKRTLAHLPAAHIAGVQGYLVNFFYAGGAVYWMPRFDFAQFLAYNKKYAITSFFSVPPVFLAIAKFPGVTDQFDSLLYAVSGAAPMGRELQLAVQKKLGKGKVQFTQTWGLSETTGSMTVMPRGEENDLTGSVSRLLSNGSARIVDDDGRDVEVGEPGEIWVKGPNVTRGYWKDEKATNEAFSDGWFKTGDVGLFRDGLFYIVDRKKELIKYKGSQVAPAELEALLVSHPKILDAAVIGVSGDDTEVPRAYVVPSTKDITPQEVVEWVNGQVSNPKKLRGGVVFLPEIPKSPSGKILRRDLRERAKKEGGSKL